MADRHLTIHFTDGTHLPFSFPRQQQGAAYNMTQRVQELLKDQYLMIEADGTVMLFPFANIKYIQVSPAPDPLPVNVIRDATLAG
jgi:hypothetical protein